ncbi:hypothetical protein [Comamonas terrae]|uniref:Tail fiber protein n=1 Tax=Comamonas terrae TaxID=673548 RepID=A0ABW5USM1_9BURK|nr:hypothetical protein [Comamonas terrae]
MASPVDTSVKHFYSSMAGAPTLAGQAGSMIALLDACLVTGWGLKAVDSAVISNGVCRMNFASGKSAAEVAAVILVAGATPAGLNGEQKVTAISSTWVEFKTALPDGPVSGSVTFKMAPAGWAKVFAGTNLAAYQSLDPQSTKMFVRVDDTAAADCRLRGYESMTDVSTGVGLFPTDSQINGGGWLNKSGTAGATPVKWRIVANSRSVYISVVGYTASDSRADAGRTVFIGDFQSYRPGGDPYAFAIGCATSSGYSQTTGVCDGVNNSDQYAPRGYSGLGSAVGLNSFPESGSTGTSGTTGSFGAFPSPIDGGLRITRRLMLEGSTPRGGIPGLYTISQSGVGAYIAPLTRLLGVGPLDKRNLLAIGCGSNSSIYPSTNLGISLIDIDGPWEY